MAVDFGDIEYNQTEALLRKNGLMNMKRDATIQQLDSVVANMATMPRYTPMKYLTMNYIDEENRPIKSVRIACNELFACSGLPPCYSANGRDAQIVGENAYLSCVLNIDEDDLEQLKKRCSRSLYTSPLSGTVSNMLCEGIRRVINEIRKFYEEKYGVVGNPVYIHEANINNKSSPSKWVVGTFAYVSKTPPTADIARLSISQAVERGDLLMWLIRPTLSDVSLRNIDFTNEPIDSDKFMDARVRGAMFNLDTASVALP